MSHIPIAHFGHWYVQIAFAAPALVILADMVATSWRFRARKRCQRRNKLRHDREHDRPG